jgi:phosphonate transport system permease protein
MAAMRRLGFVTVFVVLLVLAGRVCGVNLADLRAAAGKGLSLLTLFFPPAWADVPSLLQPVLATMIMAISATVLGTLLSFPCALAASSNLAPGWLRLTTRCLIGFERGLPEIVLLLFAVVAIGLGALPGLIALSVSSVGMLAKLLADATEEIEPQLLESISVTGATHAQVIRYAVLPQILPGLLANALFRFEVNVRAAVLLGAVGAGGIGYELFIAMSALEYRRATIAIGASLLLVIISERTSDFFRARILNGGQKT